MNFKINYEKWNNVFSVPKSLIEEEIRLAGALQLKVILWILSHPDDNLTQADISKVLGVDNPDIADAIQYWKLKNYIIDETPAENEKTVVEFDIELKEKPPVKPAAKKIEVQRLPKPDSRFIAQRLTESEELSWLMQETQVILGKALSPGLSSLLILIYDDLTLPADIILMIVQYAKMRGRASTSYIEAVARNWSEEEIFTHSLAEEKLKRLDEASKAWNVVRGALGLERRTPSKKEEQFSDRWINQWNFSASMISEAYNRCIDSTSKLNFSYINKVLENWFKKDIKTISDLKNSDSDFNTNKKTPKTFDINDLDKLINSF